MTCLVTDTKQSQQANIDAGLTETKLRGSVYTDSSILPVLGLPPPLLIPLG